MIRLLASLSPAQIALVCLLWASVCAAITVWLCPRIFRFTPKDDE